jgi:hypothetical protein
MSAYKEGDVISSNPRHTNPVSGSQSRNLKRRSNGNRADSNVAMWSESWRGSV